MKIFLKYCLIPFALMLLIACEENFSPKDDFKEEYVLNSIIRSNTGFQTATVLKSFDVEGFDPSSYRENMFVEGAEISLKYMDTTYYFKDTLINSSLNQRFENPIKLYYLDDFSPDRSREEMILTAVLPDGKVLNATSLTAIGFGFDSETSTAIPPSDGSSNLKFLWMPVTFNYFQYYIYRLLIHYSVIENGERVNKFFEVPSSVKFQDDEAVLTYPAPTRTMNTIYHIDAVKYAMSKLGEGIENKKDIKIERWGTFEVLAMDEHLAGYYFAGLSENIYTVRLDEIVYGNVSGGYGIFGNLLEEERLLRVSDAFIKSFGYNPPN